MAGSTIAERVADVTRGFLPGWIPLFTLTGFVVAVCPVLPPWLQMWALAVAIFAGFKWWSVSEAFDDGVRPSVPRLFAYLALWPGMDARTFLDSRRVAMCPGASNWVFATTKTLLGIWLVWGVARWLGDGLLAGWTGMVGMILMLHFGVFHGVALFWQRLGICAQPLMRAPLLATSLGDFWGRRWNSAFQCLAFDLMFRPMVRRVGPKFALVGTFAISGGIHDLVISLPTGGGYGLPTLYFLIQGVGVLAERFPFVATIEKRHPRIGRGLAMAVVTLPAGFLFPPLFVERVILPFMRVIGAL